jgi:hypothetical protein
VERASGTIATQAVARMDETLPWFKTMPPDQRSWVMLVAQAGIAAFVQWLREGPHTAPEPTVDVFGAAPREMARSVSLQQAVALTRVVIEVMEAQVGELAAPGEEAALREAVLKYSREVAFAAARIYAGVAESRGAWDARLQALLVDALVRGDAPDTLAGRAAALGWGDKTPVSVVVGSAPDTSAGEPAEKVLEAVERAARHSGLDVLGGVHGNRMIVVLGGAPDPVAATRPLLSEFGPGPVVVGPVVPDLAAAVSSARAAIAGHRAAPAWPTAPQPVPADELLPERILVGDGEARRILVEDIYTPLVEAGSGLLETLVAYVETGGTLEGTARLLFVHPNTVRYRLRRIAEVCGRSPSLPRDAYVLRLALALGLLEDFGNGELG